MRQAILLPLIAAGLACGRDPVAPPTLAEADVRILFVGNSLTYGNDLPAWVAAFAADDGDPRSVAIGMIARPNFALVDHVAAGVLDAIRDMRPDVVVMQQGPSSLDESFQVLLDGASAIADALRETGGTPALLMVWPSVDRLHAFDAVRDHYRAAAQAVGGIFIPGGEVWREAWRADPDLPFYAGDGFHPSTLGTVAAALTVRAALFPEDPDFCPDPGDAALDAGTLATLCAAVAAVTGQ